MRYRSPAVQNRLCCFNQKESKLGKEWKSFVAIMEVILFTIFCNRSLKRHQSNEFKHTHTHPLFMQHLDMLKFFFSSDIVNAKTFYSLKKITWTKLDEMCKDMGSSSWNLSATSYNHQNIPLLPWTMHQRLIYIQFSMPVPLTDVINVSLLINHCILRLVYFF